MIAQGAITGDLADQGLWYSRGVYLNHARSKLNGLGISRPMLENEVRRRLLQLPNVRMREQCNALEPVSFHGRGCVTGILVQDRVASNTETIDADLVVDAGGRGSSSPTWLSKLGYSEPPEEQIKVNVNYVSRFYRRLPEHLQHALHGKLFAIIGADAPDWRFGTLLGQEGDRWIVSLGGYLNLEVPTTDSGFVEFAASLAKPEIYNVIKNAEPLSEPTSYHFSSNVRRRYEKLARFPEGYLVFGDALCVFNPTFGQGMTVACMESLLLRDCLNDGQQDIGKRFFRAASRLVDVPWQIVVGSDLRNSGVEGKRTMQVRFVNWYLGKYFQAAQYDGALARKFLEVANLMEQPAALMSPAVALSVWKRNRQPAPTSVTRSRQ
jgi:2-polyprenyl-6-methoxyphenol hydroxylase-like FAD-dependent oxidoreductase